MIKTTGRVLHRALNYDLTVWLMTYGRERIFREKTLELAGLEPGFAVLDVGCGTGTLAILAKREVGENGLVCGIDASPEMIERAKAKARRAGAAVTFQNAAVEALPFPEAHFDVVLSTVMLHHLPRKARLQCLQEIRRVLKPGGRLVIVDFDENSNAHRGVLAHIPGLRHRHGFVKSNDLLATLKECCFHVCASGSLGYRDMFFAQALAGEREGASVDHR